METKKLTFKNYNVNYMQLKETKQQLCLSVVIIFLTKKKNWNYNQKFSYLNELSIYIIECVE